MLAYALANRQTVTRGSVIAVVLIALLVHLGCSRTTKPATVPDDLVPLHIDTSEVGWSEGWVVVHHLMKKHPDAIDPRREPTRVMAPRDTVNLARWKPVSSSDETASELQAITQGDRVHLPTSLASGLQWIQIDLEDECEIYAIAVWHDQLGPAVFNDVIVQVSNDRHFITGVKTLYNNDRDGSAGLGRGTDAEYLESHAGRTIEAKGTRARYVRLYSNNGDAFNGRPLDENLYVAVHVYGRRTGRPKPAPETARGAQPTGTTKR